MEVSLCSRTLFKLIYRERKAAFTFAKFFTRSDVIEEGLRENNNGEDLIKEFV